MEFPEAEMQKAEEGRTSKTPLPLFILVWDFPFARGELPGTVKIPARAVRFRSRSVLRGTPFLLARQGHRHTLRVWWGGGLEDGEGGD